MKQRTKDLVWIYMVFALFAIVMLLWSVSLKSCKDQINQPQEAVQEQQEETPTIYDTSITNPAGNVKVVEQLPEFPSGCEFAAAVSFLNAYGYDVNISSLLNYMNYSDDNYIECYVGDARADYGYCYAPALVICMNNYLFNHNAAIGTQNFTGITYKAFKEYISSNQPMIVWYTSDGEMPQYYGELYNNHFQMYSNEHVIVVYEIGNGIITAADSLNGKIEIPEEEFQQIWEACGSQCIGVYDKN